jgi:hypothetical protein
MAVMPNTMPEGMPIVTYVATVPDFNDFLARAKKFHQIWGLKPITVSSLEGVVSHLAKQTGKKSRIRIVTHAFQDLIFLSLFRGGQKDQQITADLLNAFAKSDVRGLTLLFGNIVDLSAPLGGTTVLETILSDLRANAQNVLQPFGLLSSSPSGAVLELFQRSVEQVALQKAKPKTSKVRTMQSALDIMLDENRTDGLRRRVRDEATVTLTQVKRLEGAIIDIARNFTITLNTPSDPNYFLNLKTAVKAITRTPKKDSFRNILTQARKRFAANSIIDIRGCRAGANLNYLKAIANFFGSNSTKPKVTGPDFFQSFPTPGSTKFNSEDASTLVSSKPELKGELDQWAQVTNYANTISPPSLKLNSYCDRFVLPVPEVDSLGRLDGTISMLVLGAATSGSSGFSAITHWLDSQWLNPSPALEAAKNSLIMKWSSQNRVPQIAALSKFLHDPTVGQETFVVPDPRYMQHIKST